MPIIRHNHTIFTRLNSMNIKWKNFNAHIQNKLIEKIERTIKDMNTQEFSNTLYR